MPKNRYSSLTHAVTETSLAIAVFPAIYLFGTLATENGSEGYTLAETLPVPIQPLYYAISAVIAVAAIPVAIASFLLLMPLALLGDAISSLSKRRLGHQPNIYSQFISCPAIFS